jgi:hypothetical protein
MVPLSPDRVSLDHEIAEAATLALGSAITLEADHEALVGILGLALGYSLTEQGKVNTGRHSARSIATEAALRIVELESLLAISGNIDAVRTEAV